MCESTSTDNVVMSHWDWPRFVVGFNPPSPPPPLNKSALYRSLSTCDAMANQGVVSLPCYISPLSISEPVVNCTTSMPVRGGLYTPVRESIGREIANIRWWISTRRRGFSHWVWFHKRIANTRSLIFTYFIYFENAKSVGITPGPFSLLSSKYKQIIPLHTLSSIEQVTAQ